jgi:Holliday junction DNA helicase RuvA
MIAHLDGKLIYKSPEYIIVDVNGVGYRAQVPLSTFYELPDTDARVRLTIYTHIREDLFQLYGFLTQREREIFQLLINVSGVGPRLALNILSGIEAGELCRALSEGDTERLNRIPGVGMKTAERLIVELKTKFSTRFPSVGRAVETVGEERRLLEDATSALVNLGYHKPVAEKAVKGASRTLGSQVSIEKLLREALKTLSKP